MNVFRKANLRLGAVVLAALVALAVVLEAQANPGFFSKIFLGSASVVIQAGTGSPEAAVSGSVGDIYIQTNGGVGTTLWVKEAGAATTTGWEAKAAGPATSAALAAALSDETGTGAVVFANTPTLVTPNIGAATGTSVNLSGSATIGGTVYVGDTANTFSTLGLTLNQGAADNEILSFKSSDVAHGITSETETDTWVAFRKVNPTNGGLRLRGITSGTQGFVMEGWGVTDDTTKTTAAIGYITLNAAKKSGTSVAGVGANANLVTISDQVAGARFIFDAEGSAHADVEWTMFDTHDDLALLKSLEFHATKPDNPHKPNLGQPSYTRGDLEAAKLVAFDKGKPDARPMINLSKMPMLLSGAVRQEADARFNADADHAQQIAALEARVASLEATVNDLAAGRMVSTAGGGFGTAQQGAAVIAILAAAVLARRRRVGQV